MKLDLLSTGISGTVFVIYLGLMYWRHRRGKQTAAISFSTVQQLKTTRSSWRIKGRQVLPILRVLAVLSLLFAFCRPQRGLEIVRTAREGIAIQMVIDRSSSMKEPLEYRGEELNRLEVVKRVFQEFVQGNKAELKGRHNDMIGLTSFAGFVEENAPLTLDHGTLVNFARTITPAIRIEDGTMIGDALYYSTLRLIAVDELLRKAGERDHSYKVKSKIIILLTDGQQTRGGKDPIEAAEFARENKIKVYTIAISSDKTYARKNSIFGQFFSLMERPLDTTMLERVAAITGGVFSKASSGEALVKIYQNIDRLEKSAFSENFTTYKEIFPRFVLLGMSLLCLELILSQTLLRKIP